METNNNWKRNALIFGAVIGAVVGVVAANMLVKEAEEKDNQTALTPGKGMQLGMLILGLLRQITSL
jgi:gas vesicle protein